MKKYSRRLLSASSRLKFSYSSTLEKIKKILLKFRNRKYYFKITIFQIIQIRMCKFIFLRLKRFRCKNACRCYNNRQSRQFIPKKLYTTTNILQKIHTKKQKEFHNEFSIYLSPKTSSSICLLKSMGTGGRFLVVSNIVNERLLRYGIVCCEFDAIEQQFSIFHTFAYGILLLIWNSFFTKPNSCERIRNEMIVFRLQIQSLYMMSRTN